MLHSHKNDPPEVKFSLQQRHLLRVFMIINVVAAVAVLVGTLLFVHDRAEIRAENRDIQAQRYDAAYRSCRAQNARHDQTIRAINGLINKEPSTERSRARAQIGSTLLVIDAIVPKRNCRKAAAAVVITPPVTPPLLPRQSS
jgi:hypothetical protein